MPNTSKGYNGSTDFLKWYKGNYGTDYDKDTGLVRKEGMSDGDWDVGTILHNYYIKDQQLATDRQEKVDSINQRYDGMRDTAMAGYDSARQALGENKATAQQNASITYDKLKKYLPMKARAQGLGGLGTESSGLQAYNTYMTQMGGIASDYQENMRAIDTEETSSLGELERYRTDSLDEADTLYDNLSRANADSADDEAKAAWDGYLKADKQKKDEAYAMAQSILASSTSGDVNELLAYVNGLSGKVSPEQLAALGEYAKSVADANYKKATDEQTSKQQSEFGNAYNMALGVLQSSTSTDANELMAYVNGLSGKVSPEQFAALQQIARNVAGTNLKTKTDADQANANMIAESVLTGLIDSEDYEGAKKFIEDNKDIFGDFTFDVYNKVIGAGEDDAAEVEAEEEQAAQDERIINGQEFITYEGNQFRLEEKLDKNANEIVHNDSFKEQLRTAGFSGPYDSKIPNGTTFLIKRDMTGGDKTDMWDFVPFANTFNATTSGLERYITYYNGEWYFSERPDGVSAPSQAATDTLGTKPNKIIGKGPLGQYIVDTAGQMVTKDGATTDDRNVGGGSFGNSGGGGGRGNSSSHSHNSGTSTTGNGFLDAYINASSQPSDPTAQAGQTIGGWIAKYLQSLFKK